MGQPDHPSPEETYSPAPGAEDQSADGSPGGETPQPQDGDHAEHPSPLPFTVVGIGASAGGLEAFSVLLNRLPSDTGMAFVLIQHLDPKHASALAGLLGPRTQLPVVEVSDGDTVAPNHVYVIPPNASMTIAGSVLHLTRRPESRERNMPIDTFFCSLAEQQKGNAIGVVLSGAASDGTFGLKAIKGEGGITFAQDESARFDGMPRSAIAAGVVDFVLAPEQIAEELAGLARDPYRTASARNLLHGPVFEKVLGLLRTSTGMDFSQYKTNTLLRRMERRMILQKAGSPERYLEILQKNPIEIRSLSDDLLINVTEFFRDPPVFEALKQVVYPKILKEHHEGEAIRIWVAACSTGEEVYSTAICLLEYLQESGLDFPVHIFGTDLSQKSIEKARAGIFAPGSVSAVSSERLKRFFVEVDAGYQIARSVRDRCVFAVQNLAADPPFSRMDLISCRNLLIYLSPELQRRIMNTLYHALQPRGFLLLGSTETPGSLVDYFTPVDIRHKIYSRKAMDERPRFELPARVAMFPVFRDNDRFGGNVPGKADGGLAEPLQRQVDQLLLQYAPPSVVIGEDYRIIEFRGPVGPYLAPESGQADLDLFRMLRTDVGLHLRAAVEEAQQKNMGIRLEGIHMFAEPNQTIAITVHPLLNAAGRHFLVSFESEARVAAGDAAPRPKAPADPSDPVDITERVPQLESELISTRRYLQSIIEELRSANEEAQSTNEELLSSNEELQTAKEELQASNEELQTLNAEMEGRNHELNVLTDDLSNLLTSLQSPILMLDSSLRIRRFTQASEKLLNLIPTDIGRPVSDLQPRIKASDLDEIIQQVVQSLAPDEREVQDHSGRWYSLRVRPYRTSENRIEGAVLQLIDVDQLKKSLEEVKRARDYAAAIVETVREPLIVLDAELKIEAANRAFFQTFRASPSESLSRSVYEVGGGQFNFPKLRDLLTRVAGGDSPLEETEIEREFERIGRRTMLVNARRIEQQNNQGLILLAFQDITQRKRSAEARYRRLFEAAKDGMLIVDAETGEITDANPFVESLFGYQRQELVGRKVWDIEPLRNIPGVEGAMEGVRGQEMMRLPDLQLNTKNGRAVHVEIVANEYQEEERRVVQFNIRDITERRKFEHQLEHTQKLESLGLLAGGIAHDFNNLLAGIMGNASLGLTELPDSDPVRKYLREIVSASQRAANLTRQMLAYAGKGRFVMERLDVSQVVKEIEPLIHTSIPKMVAVELQLANDLPAIEADPGQLQQLVMNLIINGAEAISEGGPGTVSIRTETRQLGAEEVNRDFLAEHLTPGKYVSLEVCDNGVGMDQATRSRIFDPFFTTKFQGRGLGLAAVSGIVRTQRGAIRVYSSPGRGSSFQVLFPSVPGKPAMQTPKITNVEAPADGKLLFVDDESMLRTFAKAALERNGWHVLLAQNGAEAVRIFEENKLDISAVILDVAMPVMGGEEALTRIKEIRSDVPVVISTGYDQAEAARHFAGKDVAGYLQKPFTVPQLVEIISVVLSQS